MSSAKLRRPTDKEHAPYYAGYVSLVPDGDLFTALEQQAADTQTLLRPIGEAKSQHRYAPDKWSIREVIGHVADSERVFTPFFTTKQGGLGLGLAITQKIIRMHGGTVSCDGGAVGGVCFRVQLPLT